MPGTDSHATLARGTVKASPAPPGFIAESVEGLRGFLRTLAGFSGHPAAFTRAWSEGALCATSAFGPLLLGALSVVPVTPAALTPAWLEIARQRPGARSIQIDLGGPRSPRLIRRP